MKNSIVVTGASGFVGRKLVIKFRDAGYQVVAIDVTNPDIEGIYFIENDIGREFELDLDKVPRNAIFIHLAALSTDGLCKKNPQQALETNLVGTSRMVEIANIQTAKKFIFASSEWVYPENSYTEAQKETDFLRLESLNSLYAMTKLMGENLVRSICVIPTTVLRFGIVYGPRSTPGSAPESIALKVSQGVDVSIGSRGTARRFIYIDDLVEGIFAAALTSKETGYEIFNLSGDKLLSLADIAEVSMKITKKQVRIVDEGLTPSIRNPDPTEFIKKFESQAKVTIEDGLMRCLKAMTGVEDH